ncbi:Long-chain-fatty-acid--CoA ligase 4 isoform 1 [Schistosoma japonicum]|uniref:long-chain-fatty-acid--CoA ligase n=2 Tax=Schistosoma japonicum TaxID=6182 RepID=A0A4Z2D358_SCHJA|nr:Long-chain-fatty-acid--CoA ligase 4 [Schistosoma japonicum]TNN10943.1 Long-chain-fatty-acid--CoA ligase 4 isoform 1 [Schistosoma japonicum]
MRCFTKILVVIGIEVIKLVVYAYEYLTWPLYYLFSKTLRYMPLPNSPVESDWTYNEEESRTLALPVREGDPGSPWRAVEALDGLTSSLPGCKDLVDVWLRTVKLWPDLPAFGTRAVLRTDYRPGPDGRQMIELTLGEYSWETFWDAERRVSNLAAGLFSMLGSIKEHNQPVTLFSETRAEWMFAAQACFRLNRPVATLYATLSDDALVHGFNETEAVVVFTSDELLSKVIKIVQRCPSIQRIIYFTNGVFNRELYTEVDNLAVPAGSATASVAEALTKCPPNLHLHDIIEVERLGAAVILRDKEKQKKNISTPLTGDNDHSLNGYEGLWMPPASDRASPSDLAVIMYTSGSTGQPKGVEMTHENLVSAIAGHLQRLPKLRSNYDIYVGYLPLAHVLELTCELSCVIMGVRIGYSNPQTLTDTSSRIKRDYCLGDVSLLRPTLFASVPIILERISKAVWEKVNAGGEFLQALFKFAYAYKCRRIHGGFPSFLVDRLVFRKVRSLMGGRIRYIVCGGAPLSEDSQLFTNICIAPIVQGYGLTESCSTGALMECGDLRCNHTGAPASTLQIRLRAWPEGGYSPYDTPSPRGEILLSGKPVSRGYYRQPELTARDFITDPDGTRWFCTGDIGLMHTDGSLSIIDRKKDLVKLQAGEYVSLSKVEMALSQSVYVEQICVYVDPTQTYPICFVSPKSKPLLDLAESLNLLNLLYEARSKLPEESMKDPMAIEHAERAVLCKHPMVIQAVLKDLHRVAKEKRLSTFEIPQKLALDTIAWTPDTGLVTDALKLKRFNLQTRFQREIDDLYRKNTRA